MSGPVKCFLSVQQIQRWLRISHRWPRSDWSSTSKANEKTTNTKSKMKKVCSDRRLTIREMANELNLSFYAVQSILNEDLNMH